MQPRYPDLSTLTPPGLFEIQDHLIDKAHMFADWAMEEGSASYAASTTDLIAAIIHVHRVTERLSREVAQ